MYEVADAATLEELIEKVNTLLRAGWEPIGGIIITQVYGMYHFNQALIKHNNSWYGKEQNNVNA